MSFIFGSVLTATMTFSAFFACMVTSVVLGAAIAFAYIFTTKKHTAGFVITLALIPAVVQIIILLVNGNLGAGVAVAGAFSLVRFRSIPGTAKEIGAIFLALSTGLATGMGYIAIAIIYTVVMIALLIVYNKINLGGKRVRGERMLTIVVPESLNYTEALVPVMKKFTKQFDLVSVKTTNMGSLFKLKYEITLKDVRAEKAFIDELRVRNGNLEIMCARDEQGSELL